MNKECGNLIIQRPGRHRDYCSNACRQSAYRQRKEAIEKAGTKKLEKRCLNCGKKFETIRYRQKFDTTSCRVSYSQQMKRLKVAEELRRNSET